MGRPYKCRICGHRFSSDEDICPECFTARDDDIGCEQFGHDEHTHGSGLSTAEDSDVYDEFRERSFIDEQRSEEANDPIPSATYGGRMGTPPPTYAQQSYQDPGPQTGASYGGQSRAEKLAALRNAGSTAGGPPPGYNARNVYFGQGQPNNGRVYYTRNGQKQKSNSAVIAVVVIIFLSIFFVPFIIGMISAVNGTSGKSRTTTAARKKLEVSYNMPDISLPDIITREVLFMPKISMLSRLILG